MLIRRAEVWPTGIRDVRIVGGAIAEIGALEPRPGERVIEALGGALLPGLHDHHIHLAAHAARAASVWCGPPDVACAYALADRLARVPGSGWIRGIGYHESVMGLPGAAELDSFVPDRPLRIQHRSGRMWLLNSRALAELLARAEPPPGLERAEAGFTGRLFDDDVWLRKSLGSAPPDLGEASAQLAAFGVTGVTDLSPSNDPNMASHFAAQIAEGKLLQHCLVGGMLSLSETEAWGWRPGPAKLHLHESDLPVFEDAVAFAAAAHDRQRPVAVHCVSETELVFALAVLEEAGARPGDRIEHSSVASPELVARIAALGLCICVQPHFLEERGDRYLVDVEARHVPDLYRLRSLADAGIALAGGSDAPFGSADPWRAMAAAVTRTTREGAAIGPAEALSPEEALALYLAAPDDLARRREIAVGAPADLCLLDRPWSKARDRLASGDVVATVVSGRLVHDGVDQAPG